MQSSSSSTSIQTSISNKWMTSIDPCVPADKQAIIQLKIEESPGAFFQEFDPTLDYFNKGPGYVAWDRYDIKTLEETVETPLYTKQVGCCIAVLLRGKKQNTKETHLGICHVWEKPEILSEALQLLSKKIERGTIEVFLSSGYKHKNFEFKEGVIRRELLNFQEDNPNLEMISRGETLYITERSHLVFSQESDSYVELPKGLKVAGFKGENPFQILYQHPRTDQICNHFVKA